MNVLIKQRALAVPTKLASDFTEAEFRDNAIIISGKKENIFLNRRGELRQEENLGKPRRRDVAQASPLPVARHSIGNEPVLLAYARVPLGERPEAPGLEVYSPDRCGTCSPGIFPGPGDGN
jgi:hypothetical protein